MHYITEMSFISTIRVLKLDLQGMYLYDSGVHAYICNKDLHGEVIPVVEHATSDYRWAKYASKKHAAIGVAMTFVGTLLREV